MKYIYVHVYPKIPARRGEQQCFEAWNVTLTNHLNPDILEVLWCQDHDTAGTVLRSFPRATWSHGKTYRDGPLEQKIGAKRNKKLQPQKRWTPPSVSAPSLSKGTVAAGGPPPTPPPQQRSTTSSKASSRWRIKSE